MRLCTLLLLLATVGDALQLVARPVLPRAVAQRSTTAVMQAEPPKDGEKLTWNTALDADGETYYWNSAGASTYEKPADFDPATAKASGAYKGSSKALYDDEIPETDEIVYTSGQKKPQLSNTMREKMIQESRGLGADPSQKNPFLLVFGGVGVFVILGALAVNL